METEMKNIARKAGEELASLTDPASLEGWKVKYLGRKGEVAVLMKKLAGIPQDERPAFGRLANSLKQELTEACSRRLAELQESLQTRMAEKERVDITLPGRPLVTGNHHLSTKTLSRIIDIFTRMGFQVLESPEVETDDYNFTFLNMPGDHPAREMWDTFYLKEGNLLRTHTSPGQIHAMRRFHPDPIRVILPGKCYRYEAVTARSEFMFHQVEGLAVGHSITMADLRGVLVSFARQMFGAERRVRLRGSYFPFTEPSVEVDMDCILCEGRGCRLCKETGWLEIAGAGMVHPAVLANGGYDPGEYTGFAFGLGPERVAMLIHEIDDIRYFFGNDLRFLGQF